MVEANNRTPTSTLTPNDVVQTLGAVDFHRSDSALNERENFRRLGSFWTRQLSPKGIEHAKALASIGLKTKSLDDVENVINNFSNDRQNLYFNSIRLPLEGLIPVESNNDVNNILSLGFEDIKKYIITDSKYLTATSYKTKDGKQAKFFIWVLKPGYTLYNVTYSENSRSTETLYSGDLFKQFGQLVIFDENTPTNHTSLQILKESNIFKKYLTIESFVPVLLCSGFFSQHTYIGQSFYKPLLGLEYLPVGLGAQFVSEYISGKHQTMEALEIMLNYIVGLETNFGRNKSIVLEVDANADKRSDIQGEKPLFEGNTIKKSYMILKDHITNDTYTLSYIGQPEKNIIKGSNFPPNTFGSYLVQLAVKRDMSNDSFYRVSKHTCDPIELTELSSLAITPSNSDTPEKIYTGYELSSLIRNNLDTTLIVHLGSMYKWNSYHKYMCSRYPYFKQYFKTYQELIQYVIRTVHAFAPITYTPIFTCTYKVKSGGTYTTTTSDYNLFLTRSADTVDITVDPAE